jgi:hypothetical protein
MSLNYLSHITPEKKGRFALEQTNGNKIKIKMRGQGCLRHIRPPCPFGGRLRVGETLALRWGRNILARSILRAAESCYLANFHTSKTLTNGSDAPVAEPVIEALH